MDTADKLVTVAQAAEHLGKTPQGPTSIGSKLVTMGQLKSAVDGSDPSGSGKLVTLSQLKRVQTLKIVSWADGTDEEIAAMVAAADAGKISLSDYWNEGDTRTVHLAAMAADGVGESHVAQDVEFVLSDPGHFTLASGKPCNFVVLQKDCLNENGHMNPFSTNAGGWEASKRREWCNSTYRNAIPSTLRDIFKQFKVRTSGGFGYGVTESTDWFSLFSEKEVFGSTSYADDSAESQNSQLAWFKNPSNRIKRVNDNADFWWERSPRSGSTNHFCTVLYSGNAYSDSAYFSLGIAPFGCI